MKKNKATLFIGEVIYKKYKEFCKKQGWIVSRQVELFMKKQLQEHGEHILEEEK